jgi:hypothetical protein
MTRTAYRWRCISYWFAAAAPAFAGAIVTAGEDTTPVNWGMAVALAIGAGFAALRGLLDQAEMPEKPGEGIKES